eukprot:scaffold115598_cov60-Phaeocystis_antarctica.AAC.3
MDRRCANTPRPTLRTLRLPQQPGAACFVFGALVEFKHNAHVRCSPPVLWLCCWCLALLPGSRPRLLAALAACGPSQGVPRRLTPSPRPWPWPWRAPAWRPSARLERRVAR